MGKFEENLWDLVVDRHGDELARTDTPADAGAPRPRARPRVLAGGTLGLAAMGAALVLVLSAGGAAAPPAFAVTRADNGSVLVRLDYVKGLNLSQLNQRLAQLGTHEQVGIRMAPGAAPVSGPVTCTPVAAAPLPGPPVKVLVGANGTDVIAVGQSAGNTAEGSFHLAHCYVSGIGSGNSGNSGAG